MESSGESVSYLEGDASRSSLFRQSPPDLGEGLSAPGTGPGAYPPLHSSSSRSSLPGILEGEDRASAALYSASNGNWNGSQGLGSRGSGGRGGASWAPGGGSPGPSGADTSRCLRVVTSTGAPANEDVIRLMAEAYGEVASISRSLAFDGALVVAYFDSRAAVLAEHMMQGAEVGPGASLRVARLGGAEAAQALPGTGVLSVVSLGGAPLTLGELASLAGAYGEVAAITVDAARPNVARVEFCDVRCAAAALQGLAGRVLAADGRRLAVSEVARPGAGAGKPPAHPSPPGSTTSAGMSAAAGGSYSNIEEQLAALGLGAAGAPAGSPPGASKLAAFGSSAALLAGLEAAAPSSSAAPAYAATLPFSASAPVLDALLQEPPSGGQGYGLGAGAGAASNGFPRSMSEVSLDGGLGYGALGAGAPTGLGLSMSTGDLLNLAGFGGAPAQPARGGGLHASPSAGSLWPPPAGGLGAQAPWGNAPAPASPASGGDVLALQQQTALTAALLQQQQQQLAQGAVMQAALQQALLTRQLLGQGGAGPGLVDPLAWGPNGALLGLLGAQQGAGAPAPTMASGHTPGAAHHPSPHHHHVPRSRSEAALGGRLARRPLEAGAEAERRVQQERLYALDIARIEAGEDKRTTLMIRNIPNKYTQKMLLALIEERFKGEFDFFYLPIDFKNKCNVGYAFINMARPACIPALVAELHGKRWPKFNSEKVCCITYGRIQGKAALVQHFQNSSLLHEDKRCRPILFRTEGDHAGEPELFPPEL